MAARTRADVLRKEVEPYKQVSLGFFQHQRMFEI